jgi:AcrR family transcriptional regulator
MTSPALSLRDRKKRRTSETIAQTTLELVTEHGFDAVRVEDICEAAEVSRSTFFRYFDSKESAYVAGFHEGRLERVLEALDHQPEQEEPLTAIRNAFLELAQEWREVREALLLDAEIRNTTPAVQARAYSELLTWETAIATAIEGRVQSRRDRAMTARLVAALAMTAVNVTLDQWLASGANRSPAPLYRRAFAAAAELNSGI